MTGKKGLNRTLLDPKHGKHTTDGGGKEDWSMWTARYRIQRSFGAVLPSLTNIRSHISLPEVTPMFRNMGFFFLIPLILRSVAGKQEGHGV
jgi:hypothetical protein